MSINQHDERKYSDNVRRVCRNVHPACDDDDDDDVRARVVAS